MHFASYHNDQNLTDENQFECSNSCVVTSD